MFKHIIFNSKEFSCSPKVGVSSFGHYVAFKNTYWRFNKGFFSRLHFLNIHINDNNTHLHWINVYYEYFGVVTYY